MAPEWYCIWWKSIINQRKYRNNSDKVIFVYYFFVSSCILRVNEQLKPDNEIATQFAIERTLLHWYPDMRKLYVVLNMLKFSCEYLLWMRIWYLAIVWASKPLLVAKHHPQKHHINTKTNIIIYQSLVQQSTSILCSTNKLVFASVLSFYSLKITETR